MMYFVLRNSAPFAAPLLLSLSRFTTEQLKAISTASSGLSGSQFSDMFVMPDDVVAEAQDSASAIVSASHEVASALQVTLTFGGRRIARLPLNLLLRSVLIARRILQQSAWLDSPPHGISSIVDLYSYVRGQASLVAHADYSGDSGADFRNLLSGVVSIAISARLKRALNFDPVTLRWRMRTDWSPDDLHMLDFPGPYMNALEAGLGLLMRNVAVSGAGVIR